MTHGNQKEDQKARCNGQGPTTRTATKGEPGHRPKERRGGRKRRNGDDDGNDDEDDGNENERPDREREKGEKKRREKKGEREATTTQPQQAQPDSIRTIQKCSEAAHSAKIVSKDFQQIFPKIIQTPK